MTFGLGLGLGFQASPLLGRAGTSGPPAPTLRNLSTRGNFHIQTTATSGTNLTFKGRIPFVISSQGGGVTTLVPFFANWRQQAGVTPFELDGAFDVTITKCAIEYNGVTVPITVGGSRSFTVTAGTAKFQVDPITVGLGNFGVTKIPAGATVYFRVLHTMPSTSNFPSFAQYSDDASYRYNKDSGGTNVNLSDDVDSTGIMAVPSGSTMGLQPFIPVGLFGYFANGDVNSVFFHGDSIAQGSNDAPSNVGYGWIRRGATTAGHAIFGMAIAGMRVTDWTGQSQTKRRSYIPHFTHCLNQVGFNDLSPGNTPISGNQTIWSDFASLGIARANIYQCLHGPKTSSTSTTKWTTLAGQTVSNGAFNAAQEVYTTNAYYPTAVGTLIGGTVDASATFRDAGDDTKWKLSTFTTTLAAAYTAAATTISLTAAPVVGEWLAVSSAGTFDASIRRVQSVTGAGPYTVTLGSSNLLNAGFTSAHSISDPITGVPTNDGTHPNDLLHAACATANASYFSGLVSAGVC